MKTIIAYMFLLFTVFLVMSVRSDEDGSADQKDVPLTSRTPMEEIVTSNLESYSSDCFRLDNYTNVTFEWQVKVDDVYVTRATEQCVRIPTDLGITGNTTYRMCWTDDDGTSCKDPMAFILIPPEYVENYIQKIRASITE
jgi:hypothetical protein